MSRYGLIAAVRIAFWSCAFTALVHALSYYPLQGSDDRLGCLRAKSSLLYFCAAIDVRACKAGGAITREFGNPKRPPHARCCRVKWAQHVMHQRVVW